MSQLFDSLRRSRGPAAQPRATRAAHGDAVLATLGYAPVRPRHHRSRIVVSVLGIALLAASWIAWQKYTAAPATQVLPRRATSPVIPKSSSPSAGSPSALSGIPSTATVPSTPEEVAPPAGAPRMRPRQAAPFGQLTGSGPVSAATPSSALPATRPEAAAAAPDNDLDLAIYYHRAGDFENALRHYRTLLDRNELNAQAHNNLGLLYQEKNLLQESARELQRAILIQPRNAGAHNNLGVTWLMQGRTDEAMAEFRTAAALDSHRVDALVNLGLAERSIGQLDTAKEILMSALNREPHNAAAHYNLAQLYDQTNEPARAVEHYRLFLENAGPEHAGRAPAVRARIAALTRTPE